MCPISWMLSMERNLAPNLTLVFYVQSLMNAVKVLKFESPKQNEETSQPSCFNLEVLNLFFKVKNTKDFFGIVLECVNILVTFPNFCRFY